MEFMNALKNESVSAENNVSFTENGMRGFRTSGNALLDMNFAVSSLRRRSARDVEAMFVNALAENFDLAVVWLFFARDVRGGGMGERRLFRICFQAAPGCKDDVLVVSALAYEQNLGCA